MAKADYVYCFCCKTNISRKREREHRRSYTTPYPNAPNIPTSRQQPITESIFESDDDEEGSDIFEDEGVPNMHMAELPVNEDIPEVQVEHDGFYPMLVDVSDDEDDGECVQSYRWANTGWPGVNNDETDEEEGGGGDLIDDDPSGTSNEADAIIDWDLIEKMSGLSAWDQMGEAYEREAATTGESFQYLEPECLELTNAFQQ